MSPNENLEKLYPDRKAKLEKIIRYHAFDTMFYRSNDWIHSLRVRWIVEDILPLAKKYFKHIDAERVICLALVHDDAEMITGDVQAGHKAAMSKQALSKVYRDERQAISVLAKKHPIKVGGVYPYGKLLMEIFEKKTIEAQLVSYADKMDGYCESLHEVLAGNFSLLRSMIFYTTILAQRDKRFPKLIPVFHETSFAFMDLQGYLKEFYTEATKYKSFGKPHTKPSLSSPSPFPFYNRWREITIQRGGKEGLEALLKKKE